MTPRERWKNVLERKSVDRVPCDIWATDEVFCKLARELNCSDRWGVIDKLQIDAYYCLDPKYIDNQTNKDCNFWGVRFRDVSYGEGTYAEPVEHPLSGATTIKDIQKYNWPKIEWFDFSSLRQEAQQNSKRPLCTGDIEPFLIYAQLRGLEQAMVDFHVAPDMVECAFDYIFNFGIRRFERVLEEVGASNVDFIVPSEDLGSQSGPLFSMDCFKKFHKPRFEKYIKLAKQAGIYVFYHTDGAARMFIPELIELGVDILNPIQHRCPGMDCLNLKKDFGDKLIFHGAVENQEILPFGTVQQVRDEVRRCFETLGIGGGYICAPCHNLQPITPVENILAMYETIHEIGCDSKYAKVP